MIVGDVSIILVANGDMSPYIGVHSNSALLKWWTVGEVPPVEVGGEALSQNGNK